jgi:hypothetical protein
MQQSLQKIVCNYIVWYVGQVKQFQTWFDLVIDESSAEPEKGNVRAPCKPQTGNGSGRHTMGREQVKTCRPLSANDPDICLQRGSRWLKAILLSHIFFGCHGSIYIFPHMINVIKDTVTQLLAFGFWNNMFTISKAVNYILEHGCV